MEISSFLLLFSNRFPYWHWTNTYKQSSPHLIGRETAARRAGILTETKQCFQIVLDNATLLAFFRGI